MRYSRAVWLCVAVLLWAGSVSADQLGNTSIASTATNIDGGWARWFGLFEVPAGGGDVDSVGIYLNESGTSYIKAAVYTYAGGVATFIDSIESSEVSGGGAWVELPVYVGATINAGDTLLIAVRGDSDGVIQAYTEAGGSAADSMFYMAASVPFANDWSASRSSWDAKAEWFGSAYIAYTPSGGGVTAQLHIKGTVIVRGKVKCGN